MSTIGIIGAGAIGAAFAKALSRQGIEVVIANSRGPQTLASLVEELGPTARAGTREEAAAQLCWWRSTGRNCRPRWPVCLILLGGS